MYRLRQVLVDEDYPEDGRNDVDYGFESQETINLEYDGNWANNIK
jgi:hypothetical protein